MLRLNFRNFGNDSPTLMIASCVRFAADGTLRGPDNFVVARVRDGLWEVAGRSHRDLECEGPVRVRVTTWPAGDVRLFGPFRQLRTRAGVLYGDDLCLPVPLPGRAGSPQALSSLTVTFEGASRAEA